MPSPTALITGASGGIGLALAQQFANHGYDLILVARSVGALEIAAREVGARTVHHIPADLSQPHSAAALVDRLSASSLQVDVLVNNAGFGLQGEFAKLPLEKQLEMIQLNLTTVTELTGLLLPAIIARGSGGVLNVASTAAFQAGPLMSVYFATKAYVLSFTEGLAEELTGRGLKISCLCPGPTATGFAERAGMTGTKMFKGSVMDVADVAREGFDGWAAGKVVVVPGFTNRRGTLAVRLFPRSLVRRVIKQLNSVSGAGDRGPSRPH